MINTKSYKTSDYRLTKFKLLRFLVVIVCFAFTKSTPTLGQDRATAFKRAASLDNGISISWLEQTWNIKALQQNHIGPADFKLLKKLGFKNIRLPIAFEHYAAKRVPLITVLNRIDGVWKQCDANRLETGDRLPLRRFK
jgi:endoglucanase